MGPVACRGYPAYMGSLVARWVLRPCIYVWTRPPGPPIIETADVPDNQGDQMFSRSDHRKVLIVDDDPGVRQILRIMLEIDDFEVVGEAMDGVEAVPQAVASRPDFIVLDEQMPNRGGRETAAMLRVQLPTAQIIAFSAILDAKPEWADAFLEKHNIGDVAPLVEGLIDLRTA